MPSTWLYVCVVESELWPSSSWIDAEVGAALQQVCGERVPEAVRVGEKAPERARVEPPAARREEEGVLGAASEPGTRILEVAANAVGRLFAERHDPLLVALAAHANRLLLEVDVAEIEVDGLAAT